MNNIKEVRKIRKSWAMVKPYTRVEKDKTKYSRKQKHREKFL